MTFIACLCNAEGAEDDWCNVGNGQCFCKDNIVGRQCDHCVEGFYGFPACVGMYVGDKEEGEGSKPGFPYQYCRCKYHIEKKFFLKIVDVMLMVLFTISVMTQLEYVPANHM